MFFILLQSNGKRLKPKSKLIQLNSAYLTIKKRWYWVVGLAILLAGGDYLRKDVKEPIFTTGLTFLVNYEDIILASDLRGSKTQVLMNSGQNRRRQQQVLELMNDALKSQEFQAKILFSEAIIEEKSDFLANHIIHYQELFKQLPEQQRVGWNNTGLVGFKFTHSDIATFTPKEQRAFKIIARQLPRRLGPSGQRTNFGNAFIGEEEDKLMESEVAEGSNQRRWRRQLPSSFSFRARSRNPVLPSKILTTVYEAFNNYFETYHHQLLYTTKEALKKEIALQDEKVFKIKEKIVKKEEQLSQVLSSNTLLPLQQLRREQEILDKSKLSKNSANLLIQFELLAPPMSPFLLVQPPQYHISPPATNQATIYRALLVFSVVVIIGLFFLLIKDYTAAFIIEVRTIWREGQAR